MRILCISTKILHLAQLKHLFDLGKLPPLLIKIYSNHTIKAGSSAYAETETLLWLMIWTIAERQSFQAECFPAEKYGISYSAYKECKLSFIQVTDVLRLS